MVVAARNVKTFQMHGVPEVPVLASALFLFVLEKRSLR